MISEPEKQEGVKYRPSKPLLASLDKETAKELASAPPEVQNRVIREHLERARESLEEQELEFRGKERRFENGKIMYKAIIEAEPKLRRQRLILAALSMVMLTILLYISITGFNRNQSPYVAPPVVVLDPYSPEHYPEISLNSQVLSVIVKMKVKADAPFWGLSVDGGKVVVPENTYPFKCVKHKEGVVTFQRTHSVLSNLTHLLKHEEDQTISLQVLIDRTGNATGEGQIKGWAAIRGWNRNLGDKGWFWQQVQLNLTIVPPPALPGPSAL